MRLPRLQPLRSKNYLVLGTALLVVIVISGYFLWSKQVWGQYGTTYPSAHQELNTEIKEINTLPVAGVSEQELLLGKLKGISQRISAERADLCAITPLVRWQQQLIDEYRNIQAECQKDLASLISFQKELDVALAYVESDQQLAAIIAAVAPASELADDAWSDQVAVWNKAIESTRKLSVSAEFKPTQQQAIDQMTTVASAWRELIVAHESKDKAKYVAAQKNLGTMYDGLNDIVTGSELRLSSVLDALGGAYEKIK